MKPAHFIEIGPFKIGVPLTGSSMDRVRIAQLNSSRKFLEIWVAEAVSRWKITGLDLPAVDIIFASLPLQKHGQAVMEDGETWFELNTHYLGGSMTRKTRHLVDTFVHELAHIWLFHEERHGNNKPHQLLKKKVQFFRDKYLPTNDVHLEYALSDDDGEELFAYCIEFYDTITDDLRSLLNRVKG